MQNKSTNKELVQQLENRNTDGRYDEIIARAKANEYHDFKSSHTAPKLVLLADLQQHKDTEDLVDAVINGDYDEPMDEADKELRRKDAPEDLWPIFGVKRDE